MSANILQRMAEIQDRRDGLDMEEACWLLVEGKLLKDLLNMAPALKRHSAEFHHKQQTCNKTRNPAVARMAYANAPA